MKFTLNDSAREELQSFQRTIVSRLEYVKVTSILMLDKGLSLIQISDYLGVDATTVHRYRTSYQFDGIEKYLQTNYQGYWGLLSSLELSELCEEIKRTLYTDSKEIIAWIENHFGIKLKLSLYHYLTDANFLTVIYFQYIHSGCKVLQIH